MRMTRDDLSEMMRAKYRPAEIKSPAADDIAAQVAEYLAKGGKIERIDIGVTSGNAHNTHFRSEVTERRKEVAAAKRAGRSPEADQSRPMEIGITEASRIVGTSRNTLKRRIIAGVDCPPFRIDLSGAIKLSVSELRRWVAERKGGANE